MADFVFELADFFYFFANNVFKVAHFEKKSAKISFELAELRTKTI